MSESDRDIQTQGDTATRATPEKDPDEAAPSANGGDPYAHHAFGAEKTPAERSSERRARRSREKRTSADGVGAAAAPPPGDIL